MFPIEEFSSMDVEQLLLTLHASLESSDDGFLAVDCRGTIAYINTAYCDYLGVPRHEAIGHPVREIIETSHMPEVALDTHFPVEYNQIHKVSSKQFTDREQYVFVNRANVSWEGKPVAGVAQIKFVRNTLKLSSALTDLYDELQYYKDELERLAAKRFSFEGILGSSEEMRDAKQMALRAASNDFSVMITGETGTGKEVFASAIHYASPRRTKPFIRINCAAIPAELLESELFGYMEGSFTGAKKGGKKGKFELANGGTLFLDEIGEMPLVMQAKILRALQEREIERLGGEQPIPLDIRIIAATNRNLAQEISEKHFREDLYYRLNVIELTIPPLRQRKEDIHEYVDAFLTRLNAKYHTDIRMTEDARALLLRYTWPGNVRELKNIVERCYALNENGIISRFSIPSSIVGAFRVQEHVSGRQEGLDAMMGEIERRILLEEIRLSGGNLRQTALQLGIHRTTLYKKLEKYGIRREQFET